jgi:CDGSH-type Zn-finger protein
MILSASARAIIVRPLDPESPVPLVIKVRENGPYAIDVTTGDFVLVDHNGEPIPIPPLKPGKTTVTLCRCGASVKKPFCDGTHSRIGFKGAEQAAQAFDQQPPPKQE